MNLLLLNWYLILFISFSQIISKKSSRRDRDKDDEDRRRSHDSKYSRNDRRDDRRNDRRTSRNDHSSLEKYSKKYDSRQDKYRKDERSYRRDDRKRDDRSNRDRSYRKYDRSEAGRGSHRSSESDKYKRSGRDDRRKRSQSSSPPPQKEKKDRSRSVSKERKITEKKESKSPEIVAVTAPPVNIIVNTIAAERKLAKLDQLGITLTAPMISNNPAESVEIPAYYNPNAINVTKYAEQIQKRKLLWSGKKAEPAAATSTWNNATFSHDTDGKVASKFMRLMGIKDAQPKPQPENTGADNIDKQKQLFSTMEQQYEVARQVTHTMRGVGLGFGSQPRQF